MTDIPGSPSPDLLPGSSFDDVMHGYEGDDTIYGNGGADLIYGGTGNDFVNGGDSNDTIYGDAGDDTLEGGGMIDLIYGGGGKDIIRIGEFSSGSSGEVQAGAGDDVVMVYAANDSVTLNGGSGQDQIYVFWSGYNTPYDALVDFTTRSATSNAGHSLQFSGFESLAVYLDAGNDTVIGSGRNDQLWLGRGDNQVQAGAGNDVVRYDVGGTNTLDGGAGNDLLTVIAGPTPLYFIVDLYDGDVDDGQLSQISGFERYFAAGHSGNDIVSLGNGADTALGNWGDDTLFGAGGDDRLFGNRHHDQLYGGDGNDALIGGSGTDRLEGGDGRDRLQGKTEDDSLDGGAGRDWLRGGAGHDTLTGGADADQFVFSGSNPGLDLITDFTSGEDRINWAAAHLSILAPAPGKVAAAALSDGGPVGTGAQFVTQYDATADETQLLFFDQGTNTSGSILMLRMSGVVVLHEGDLWML